MRRFLPILILFFVGGTLAAQPIMWTDCAEKTFCYPLGSCSNLTVNLTATATTTCGNPTVDITNRIDFGANGSTEVIGNSATVNTVFPGGTSTITWRAATACGQVSTCTQTIIVKDCQAPNLLCLNGLTQNLDPDCKVSFAPQQFIINVSDNCTPLNQLDYGIRKAGTGTGFPTTDTITFDKCETGTNIIEVWVRDANGLANQCSNYVLVQNNTPQGCTCIQESKITFSGCARSAGNAKLQNYKVLATVEQLGANNQATLLKTKTQNVLDSCFSLKIDALPLSQNLRGKVRLQRTDIPTEGFTTYDLVLVSRHILNIEPFATFYQTVAADINNSQTITTFDIVEGRKVLLGIYDSFPAVPTWRFIKPVPNPANTIAWSDYSETYQMDYPALVGDTTAKNLNFIGIKAGDVNNSASFTGEADDRDAQPLLLTTADGWLSAGQDVTIPVYLAESTRLASWQLALKTNAEFADLIDIEGLAAEDYAILPDGSVRIAWFDAASGQAHDFDGHVPVFSLHLHIKQAVSVAELVQIATDALLPAAYSAGGQRRELHLQFTPARMENSNVQLFAPQPNPMHDNVSFAIQTTQPEQARLDIFDIAGRSVYTQNAILNTGYQAITLPRSVFSTAGSLYVYRLAVGNAVLCGKLVLGDD